MDNAAPIENVASQIHASRVDPAMVGPLGTRVVDVTAATASNIAVDEHDER